MSAALRTRLGKIEERVDSSPGAVQKTVFGIVHPDGYLLRTIKKVDGKFIETDETPQTYIAEKLEPLLTRPKRFNLVIGGRGSGKSLGVGDIDLSFIHDEASKVMNLREFQNSLEDSSFAMLKEEVSRLQYEGFSYQNNAVQHSGGGIAKFKGLARNPDSIKSAHGFKRFTIEEAQFISADSLKILTPTARSKAKPGLPGVTEYIEDDLDLSDVQMTFVANPASSQDAFSQRFIVPFQDSLERDGIYEDDLHLIIVMNWRDNPWFYQSGLEAERRFDYENLPRAYYDHIWEGAFNDSVENAIIPAEWFDACIDAHEKLGFKPVGAKVVSHDPSDLGDDPKGLAIRHGSVILDVQENKEGDVNEGFDWALDVAIQKQADVFSWDVGGMGISLKRQADQGLQGKRIKAVMFNGAEGSYSPDAIYLPAEKGEFGKQKKNREVFKNRRAQCYWRLRDRVYNTYRAIKYGEYIDPDEMISFCSTIKNMAKLRSEVCRIPRKPNGNGLIQMMTKQEMKALKIPSPNMADSVMMTFCDFDAIKQGKSISAPPPKRTVRR